MIAKQTIIVTNDKGIHARPAALIVKLAQRTPAAVILSCGDKQAPANNMMAILMLAAAKGDEITITAEAERLADITDTLDAFSALLTADFGQ